MERHIFLEHDAYNYRSFPLILGAWDYFGFDNVLSFLPKKESNNAGAPYKDLVKALVLQLTDSCYRSLSGTSEYFLQTPVPMMFSEAKRHSDFQIQSLARTLDVVHEIGPEMLFVAGAKAVFEKIGIQPYAAHVDITSFHYDGETGGETCCMVRLKKGYSRDHRPDLKQIIQLQVVDDVFGIPMFAKSFSGNECDKDSFHDFLANHAQNLRNVFKSLETLVGDSALCTRQIFDEAEAKGIRIVTRVPDSFSVAKECFQISENVELTPIKPLNSRSDKYKCCLVDGLSLFDYPVKLLVLKNLSAKERMEKKIRRDADNEKKQLERKLSRLNRKPLKCMADAEQAVEELCSDVKFCNVYNITYSPIEGYDKKGKPSSNTPKVVKGYLINATVDLDESKIQEAVDKECKFVICTTDVEHDWSMEELHGIYSRQFLVEDVWKTAKDPRHYLDAIYLQKPSRIAALMWILSLSILLVGGLEAHANKQLKASGVKVPEIVKGNRINTVTYSRLNDVFNNSLICLMRINGQYGFSKVNLNAFEILDALGPEWSKYTDTANIAQKMA